MMRSRYLGAFAILLPAFASAAIVDGIAVAVGDRAITRSEIDLRLRLTAFQNHAPDAGSDTRRSAAEKLIDQKLIEREMDVGHYPRLSSDRRQTLLADYLKTEYKSDGAAMAKELAAYSLTARELEDDLARQSDLITFLNLRFRPAVQVSDQDVEKYLASNPLAGDPDEVRAAVEKKLTNERADRELDLWLRDQRKRTKIEYMEPDLAPVNK